MKPLVLALPLLLLAAACTESEPAANDSIPTPARTEDDRLVECAPGGAANFTRSCSLEKVEDEDGVALILRAPDGGFRRLRITADGRGVIAADGAEPAQVTPLGPDRIEVVVGKDRYRLPATVRSPGV